MLQFLWLLKKTWVRWSLANWNFSNALWNLIKGEFICSSASACWGTQAPKVANYKAGSRRDIPHFIALDFPALHRCCMFYKAKARPSSSKKITTCFIAILTLLRWSGTKPALSPKYTCRRNPKGGSVVQLGTIFPTQVPKVGMHFVLKPREQQLLGSNSMPSAASGAVRLGQRKKNIFKPSAFCRHAINLYLCTQLFIWSAMEGIWGWSKKHKVFRMWKQEIKSRPCYVLAGWPWVNFLLFLSLIWSLRVGIWGWGGISPLQDYYGINFEHTCENTFAIINVF